MTNPVSVTWRIPGFQALRTLALIVGALLGAPAAASAACPAISAGGNGQYMLNLSTTGGLSCSPAKALVRDFWFQRGSTKHGGTLSARQYSTLQRWPRWQCRYDAAGGTCRRGRKSVRYRVQSTTPLTPIPSTPVADDLPPSRGRVLGIRATAEVLSGIPQRGLELGSPDAPVTIVEFIDLQCPFCKFYALEDEPEVINALVRTGRVKLQLAPVALPQMGEDSEAARNVLARLAAKNRAWDFSNLFFFNQGDEATGYVTNAFLEQLVSAVPGATPSDADRDADPATEALLKRTDRLFNGLEITGTPSYAIGTSAQDASTYRVLEPTSEPLPAQLDAAARAISR